MSSAQPERLNVARLAVLGQQSMHQILTSYLTSADMCLGRLERACADSDLVLWLQTWQVMKETSHAVTAYRIEALCQEGEMLDVLPDPKAQQLLYQMQKELLILKGEIAHALKEA